MHSLIVLAILIPSFLLSRAVENMGTKTKVYQLNKLRVTWLRLV